MVFGNAGPAAVISCISLLVVKGKEVGRPSDVEVAVASSEARYRNGGF